MKFRCSISIFFGALCALASIIFSVLCIYLLFEERNEVGYAFISSEESKIYDKSKYTAATKSTYNLTNEESVQLFLNKLQNYRYQYHNLDLEKLFCVPLNEIAIFQNQSELLLERISDDLVEHLNQTFHRSLLEEHLNANEIMQNLKMFDQTVLQFFRSRSYYILRDKLCLILDYLWFTENFLELLFRPFASYYMLIKDSHYVVRLERSNDTFDLQLIFNHNNPNLNCSSNRTEFECFNSCLKEKHRLSKYFFNGNETGWIQLLGDWSTNKSIVEHEAACFERCDEQLCVITDIETKQVEDKYSNNSAKTNNLIKVSFLEFKPLISQFSFNVQLVGLVLSFFGVSCYNLTLKLTAKLFAKNKSLIGSLFKFFLWSVCVMAFLFLYGDSVTNYSEKTNDRTAKTTVSYSKQPEQIGLVVCVPVSAFLKGDIQKMTLAELELNTNDAFNRTVDKLSLEFLNEPYEVSWKVKETLVLFSANDYSSELGRCFQVELEDLKDEPKYHSIWSELKLVINFKHPQYELYVLPEDQEFNYNSFRFDPNQTKKFNKIIFKSSALKCVDYGTLKEYGNCKSRWNCKRREV